MDLIGEIYPKSHKKLVEIILVALLGISEEYDGLIGIDEETKNIIRRFTGSGFTLGVAYGQTDRNKEPRERLSEAFKIIIEGRVIE